MENQIPENNNKKLSFWKKVLIIIYSIFIIGWLFWTWCGWMFLLDIKGWNFNSLYLLFIVSILFGIALMIIWYKKIKTTITNRKNIDTIETYSSVSIWKILLAIFFILLTIIWIVWAWCWWMIYFLDFESFISQLFSSDWSEIFYALMIAGIAPIWILFMYLWQKWASKLDK